MDTRRLMLGDYVINTEFGKNEIGKVVVIDTTRVLLENGKLYTPINYIEPIPITDEILEKNGWYRIDERVESKGFYVELGWSEEKDNQSMSLLQFRFYKKAIWGIKNLFRIETVFSGGVNKLHYCNMNYVHELQHALRLCGINREIILNN